MLGQKFISGDFVISTIEKKIEAIRTQNKYRGKVTMRAAESLYPLECVLATFKEKLK